MNMFPPPNYASSYGPGFDPIKPESYSGFVLYLSTHFLNIPSTLESQYV